MHPAHSRQHIAGGHAADAADLPLRQRRCGGCGGVFTGGGALESTAPAPAGEAWEHIFAAAAAWRPAPAHLLRHALPRAPPPPALQRDAAQLTCCVPPPAAAFWGRLVVATACSLQAQELLRAWRREPCDQLTRGCRRWASWRKIGAHRAAPWREGTCSSYELLRLHILRFCPCERQGGAGSGSRAENSDCGFRENKAAVGQKPGV